MLTSTLSLLFASLVELRNYLFDSGFIKKYYPRLPTISIGNISFGGTGKTPFVIYLSNLLLNLGYKPIILSRGYKGKHRGITIVRDNDKILCDVEQAGDELYLVAKRTQSLVIASKKKFKAIPIINKNIVGDALIIDDGFQHRKVERDLDIVLIDSETAKKPFVYPKGYLREPLRNLNRANVIALAEDVLPYSIDKEILSNKIAIRYKKVVKYLVDLFLQPVELQNVVDKRVILISGLANNTQFYNTVANLGIDIYQHFQFKDHYIYSEGDIGKILKYASSMNIDTIMTTEKDFYKLHRFSELFKNNRVNLFSTVLDLEIIEGEEQLMMLIKQILSHSLTH